MKVLYISHSKDIQGAAKALINIVDGIRKFGCKPIVIVPDKGELLQNLQSIGVPTYIINCYQVVYPNIRSLGDLIMWPLRLLIALIVNYIAEIKLDKIVKYEKPDIIHSNTGIIRYGEHIARKNAIPHVWHIREYQTMDFKWAPIGGVSRLKKLFSYENNHCIAITKGIFNFFCLSCKDVVIYDGVFHDNLILPEVPKSDYFLFVGSISYGKGILDALDAFNRVAGICSGCRFLIAGRGGVDIQKEINKSPYANRIQYLGQRSDIYKLMAGALALLVPSYYEGFGFITTEAMLNKCIVVGRDTAGTKEQFDNGRNIVGSEIGLRFLTTEQLVNCMLRIVRESDSQIFSDMKNNACFAVRQLYSIENNVKSVFNYYCTLKQR